MNKAIAPLPISEETPKQKAIIIPLHREEKIAAKPKRKKMVAVKNEPAPVNPPASIFTTAVFHPKKHDHF